MYVRPVSPTNSLALRDFAKTVPIHVQHVQVPQLVRLARTGSIYLGLNVFSVQKHASPVPVQLPTVINSVRSTTISQAPAQSLDQAIWPVISAVRPAFAKAGHKPAALMSWRAIPLIQVVKLCSVRSTDVEHA
jgi:hypothetical protein